MSNIYVTKTFLPPLEEYQAYLEKIWESRQVTNNGPYSKQLEIELREYLDVPHLKWLNNGTTGLQIAVRALELKGEILTTPFTYVATATSIIWENCTPVFVDIDPKTLSIDPQQLGNKMNQNTVALMAVHVYGYPCDVEALSAFCTHHQIPLIYDAAHAFGVRYKGQSLMNFGDLSVMSFHATKVYHTIEGGAISTKSEGLAEKVELYKAFGHEFNDYRQVGINAKNTELHAAIGILNLKYFESLVEARRKRFELYVKLLNDSELRILLPSDYEDLEYNYGYMVAIFTDKESLGNVVEALKEQQIYPRRYFQPALNTLKYLNMSKCPNAEDIAGRILCLPLYHDLEESTIERICNIVNRNL